MARPKSESKIGVMFIGEKNETESLLGYELNNEEYKKGI